jgi:hypothetical protein
MLLLLVAGGTNKKALRNITGILYHFVASEGGQRKWEIDEKTKRESGIAGRR